MIKFIVKIYFRAWYTCRIATWAPKDDLKLFQDLSAYESINKRISQATVKSFLRHLWYLSEPLVALSFFDERVEIEEKKKMVAALAIDSDKNYEKRATIRQKRD